MDFVPTEDIQLTTSNIRQTALAVAATLLVIAGTSQAQQSSPSPTPVADQVATSKAINYNK
jgi:hypothetical protein